MNEYNAIRTMVAEEEAMGDHHPFLAVEAVDHSHHLASVAVQFVAFEALGVEALRLKTQEKKRTQQKQRKSNMNALVRIDTRKYKF